MKTKLHDLVIKSKIELQKLEKLKHVDWETQSKYNSHCLPISTEPKLRARALRFMDSLIKLLEANSHSIKFEYKRCHIEMYGQLTEINLRQKYFRIRTKDANGWTRQTFKKSDKLEFQVGSYARKGWIDSKTKTLEDHLTAIYKFIEKDSSRMAELRYQQAIDKIEREKQRRFEEAMQEQLRLEQEKTERLFLDVQNYVKARDLRTYLKLFEKKLMQEPQSIPEEHQAYFKWAYKKADEIDPLLS